MQNSLRSAATCFKMDVAQPKSHFDRWWWRGWYVLVAVTLAWFAWCGWLARPAAPWTQGWVAWWTGDRMGSRPLSHFFSTVDEGSEVTAADGNPAFRTGHASFVSLGHWGEQEDTWTWAGWVRINIASGVWPTNFVVVRTALSTSFQMHVGFEHGHPRAIFRSLVRDGNRPIWQNIELAGNEAVPLGQWMHLAISTDRGLRRLVLNGAPVAEHRGYLDRSLALANLRLASEFYNLTPDVRPRCEVEQDDVVAFDRVVPAEELASLAKRGRGAWVPEVGRAAQAAQVWTRGWPLALLGISTMSFLRLMPGSRRWLAHSLVVMFQPSYRSVRWTLMVGLSVSALVAVVIAKQVRKADEQRMDRVLGTFRKDGDFLWNKIDDLLLRSRGWLSSQTNLTQAEWESWLGLNNYPANYEGVIGVGFAQQVLPDQLAAHEAEWSARHGFAYRVHPGAAQVRQPIRELAGQPYLPVVVYSPRALERRLWLTNHSILGRDLLFQSLDDRRSWAAARRVEEVAARNELQTSSLEEIAPAGWYGKPIQGLQLYVPWTLRQKPPDPRIALEPTAWRGVLFVSVDIRKAMQDWYGSKTPLVGFRIFSGSADGERLDLIADSGDFLPGSGERPDASIRRTIAVGFYYRRLWVDVWTTEAFEAESLRKWVWPVAGAGALLTLLAAALLIVQERAREAQTRVLKALRAANSELLLAYRDRERLSRDLHDGSIQNLYGLGLHLQRVQTVLADSPDRAREELNDSLAMLDHSIAELRQFILTAGVDNLQHHTVASALEGLVERLRKTTPIDIQLHVDEEAGALAPGTGVQVLNIVREAVSNAMRHADARHIEVRLERCGLVAGKTDQHWVVSINDDGRGFDRKLVNGHGRGLKNLMARAAELGGRSEIASNLGCGTRVKVEFVTNVQTNPADDVSSEHAHSPNPLPAMRERENADHQPS